MCVHVCPSDSLPTFAASHLSNSEAEVKTYDEVGQLEVLPGVWILHSSGQRRQPEIDLETLQDKALLLSANLGKVPATTFCH